MPKLTGNKGEWSEIYVFLRLLEMGRIYAATENLERIDSVFYDIIKILRTEEIGKLEFVVDKFENKISVVLPENERVLISMTASEFGEEAEKLYQTIINTSGSAFSCEETESFLSSMGVKSLKAKSTDKSDIRMKIHDINTGFEAVQGFSIKSRLGSPSTLINAGKTTNFVYEICGNVTERIVADFNDESKKKFKDKFDVLNAAGCSLKYSGMENEIFENNLVLIDGDLPEICAHLLLEYYQGNCSTVTDALEIITDKNPLKYNLTKGHPFYIYKFKKFLTECALGMLPSKAWNGTADATGGYIIVKEDGEVLCYHLFNRNEFENYLVINTKFETASTSRHDFGHIYKESNQYFIKLNLQIRFIK